MNFNDSKRDLTSRILAENRLAPILLSNKSGSDLDKVLFLGEVACLSMERNHIDFDFFAMAAWSKALDYLGYRE